VAILTQNSSAFAKYLIWFGNCEGSDETTFDLTSSDKILIVEEYTQTGTGVRAYIKGFPSFTWGFSSLKLGHAYSIILEKGQDEVEIPNSVISYFEIESAGKVTSECGVQPTPTPNQSAECCANYDNTIDVTAAMAAEENTIPYTGTGISINGFQAGGTICYDDLNSSVEVPGKIYPISDAEFAIGGLISTESEITNRVVKYVDTDGACWSVTLEDSPSAGYSVLTKE
jgi:hypothetical protein